MNNETDGRCLSVCNWYSIGESNTDESGLKPLQEGGLSHAAHECNMKCNKTHSKAKAIVLQKKP